MRKSGALLFISVLTIACQPVSFSGPVSSPDSPQIQENCQNPDVNAIQRPTKLIFLVDASGSNRDASSWPGIPGCENSFPCIPPTDPMKSFRIGTISDFLNRYSHKSNFAFSLVSFAGDKAESWVDSGDPTQPGFTNQPFVLEAALADFASQRDSGMTPYRAALSMAEDLIRSDSERAPETQYLAILITDGFPTDFWDSARNFLARDLEMKVQSLLMTAPGQVTLSTVFYGATYVPQAIDLLTNIAILGRGQFANVQAQSGAFRIDGVIPPSIAPCRLN